MYAMSQEVSAQPLPQEVAHALLVYKRELPPSLWLKLKQAFALARRSYAPELALKMAEQALRS